METKSKSVLNVTKARSCKRGIVYLGYVPEGLTVKNIRQILSKYGEVERIFLERANSEAKNSKRYTEGWIEFKKKSVAKLVANLLNGSQIKGKRRTKFYDSLWNMKYLKRFGFEIDSHSKIFRTGSSGAIWLNRSLMRRRCVSRDYGWRLEERNERRHSTPR